MSKDIKNKERKCEPKKNMIIYGSVQLTCSIISALSLATIALGLSAVKNEFNLLNDCVIEQSIDGKTISESLHFCNGGN